MAYFFGRKCSQIYCEPCSKKICVKCKIVCDKKPVSSLPNDEQSHFLIEDTAAMKNSIKSHEFQQNRMKKYAKYLISYAMKTDKKMKELETLIAKQEALKKEKIQKLNDLEKKGEELEKKLKDMQKMVRNAGNNCQLEVNASFAMGTPGNVENYAQNNSFQQSDTSRGSFKFDPVNSSSSDINQFARPSVPSIASSMRYDSRILPGHPPPFFQSTPMTNANCNNVGFGFSHSIPSSIHPCPKPITSKTFSRRP